MLPFAFNPFLCQLVHPPIERRSKILISATQLERVTILDGSELRRLPPPPLDQELRRGNPLRHRRDGSVRQGSAVHHGSEELDGGLTVIAEQFAGDPGEPLRTATGISALTLTEPVLGGRIAVADPSRFPCFCPCCEGIANCHSLAYTTWRLRSKIAAGATRRGLAWAHGSHEPASATAGTCKPLPYVPPGDSAVRDKYSVAPVRPGSWSESSVSL